MFEKWTSNDIYGGALQALHLGEIEIAYGYFLLNLDRFPYYDIISPVASFSLVSLPFTWLIE